MKNGIPLAEGAATEISIIKEAVTENIKGTIVGIISRDTPVTPESHFIATVKLMTKETTKVSADQWDHCYPAPRVGQVVWVNISRKESLSNKSYQARYGLLINIPQLIATKYYATRCITTPAFPNFASCKKEKMPQTEMEEAVEDSEEMREEDQQSSSLKR